jgi:hypothetical protein
MMLSSIVYGFGSYKAYDNKAYDNKAYDNKAYDYKAYNKPESVRKSHERISCVCFPLLPLTSATQSQSIGFMPIILQIVFDLTSSIRLL